MAVDRKTLGAPLRWTEEQIEKLSQIAPQDVEEALVLWRKYAPASLRSLLDARPEDEELE